MAALNAPNVLSLLLNLVNKSLVVASNEGEQMRYTMLETIRQFAWEQLEAAGETMFVQGQHARYLLAWLKRTAPARMRETNNPIRVDHMAVACLSWIAGLQADRENLRAALVWALQQQNDIETGIGLVTWQKQMWTLRGPREEARRWLELALTHTQSPEHLHKRAYLMTCLGSFLNRLGEPDRSLSLYREAIAIFKQVDDRFGEMYTLNQRGNVLTSDLDGFEAGLQDWLALANELQDRMYAGAALWFLGLHYTKRRNDLPRALDYFAESLRVLPEEEMGLRNIAIYYQAQALRQAGQPEGALERILDALAYFRACGFVLGVVVLLHWLGDYALAEGDSRAARNRLHEGLELAFGDGAKQFGVMYFEPFAVLAAMEQKPAACATLAAVHHAMSHEPISPANQQRIDAACAELDIESLAKVEAAGRSMTFDQAVAFALAL